MTDGSIKESQLSVSSVFQILSDKVGHEPYGAGLHREEYWAPAAGLSSHDRRQYVQVDFGSLKNIKMVRLPKKKHANKVMESSVALWFVC